jgi:hypothetical protein
VARNYGASATTWDFSVARLPSKRPSKWAHGSPHSLLPRAKLASNTHRYKDALQRASVWTASRQAPLCPSVGAHSVAASRPPYCRMECDTGLAASWSFGTGMRRW